MSASIHTNTGLCHEGLRASLRKDMERYDSGLVEDVESCPNADEFKPTFQTL